VTGLLVVTAVEAERDAVLAGLAAVDAAIEVRAVGVGPAAAAAGTAWLLARASFSAVVCAGIGGGFADRVAPGGLALASESVAADLGAESPDGFLPLDRLGFGTVRYPAERRACVRSVAFKPACTSCTSTCSLVIVPSAESRVIAAWTWARGTFSVRSADADFPCELACTEVG